MKKALWMVLASLMLFSVACGKKADTKGSQAAQTEPSSEALSENSLSATVQKLENNKLTVETGEGKVKACFEQSLHTKPTHTHHLATTR